MPFFSKFQISKFKDWVFQLASFKFWLRPFAGARQKILKLPSPARGKNAECSKQNQNHDCPNYTDLKMIFRDIGRMNAIIEALGRDFLTAMPDGAYKSRLGQMAFLSRRRHEDLADQKVADKIEQAKTHQKKCPDQWDEWDKANLFEMESMYRHHCRVSSELMEKRARLSYEGRRRHREVLKNNDWQAAQGFLQEMIDLQREVAESKCLLDNQHDNEAPYQALMREYIPGARISEIDGLFTRLDSKIKALLPEVMERQSKQEEPVPLSGPFPSKLQLSLNKTLLGLIGFDFNRGGLYETGHNPVEGGTPDDTRLVIKTSDTHNFLDSMKSALHEGGHGIYIQGLPRTQWRYQPVGQDLGAAVHESQALMIEMILGRKLEFFEYLSPRVEGLFQKFGEPAMQPDNLYRLKTWVKATPDRKTADEVTYFSHIYMRMQLERDLISGKLKVRDLPDAWNAKMKEELGVEPQSHAEGCLQDVHWFVGKFGYFPSYTLGHMMAAQFHESMKRDIQNIPDLLREGNFAPVCAWLGTKIHAFGRLYRSDELVEKVTGNPLNINALTQHFENRYVAAAA
ncbi:MAG: carboxypeptidase M32 [Alphaproteobacteria bacterium]|nr:carboxypeptidase M32 [Alphaproteobacteria bacterium]